jgi:hypothetical protein
MPFTSNRPLALAALLCLPLSACNSYSHLAHSDKISPAAGDAVHAATVMQTVDPWPDYVLDTEVPMDGELAVKRAEAYKRGETKPLQGERSQGSSSSTPSQ